MSAIARPAWASVTVPAWDETLASASYERPVTVGEVTVVISQLAEQPTGPNPGEMETWGVTDPVIDLGDLTEVSAQGARDLAQALLQAADIIDAG